MSPSNGGLTYAKRAFIDYGVSPASHGREPAAAAASRTCDAAVSTRLRASIRLASNGRRKLPRASRGGTSLKWAAGFADALDLPAARPYPPPPNGRRKLPRASRGCTSLKWAAGFADARTGRAASVH